MAVMNRKHVFNQELWNLSFRNSLLLRNKIQNSTLLPKCIHWVFLPKNVQQCPSEEKFSRRYLYPLLSSSNISERLHPSNNRLGARGLSNSYLSASEDEGIYSAAEQKAIIHEFNSASHEALCSYGFRAMVAHALEECRPFLRLVEVLKVHGIGYDSLNKACRRVHEVLQHIKDPVQPSVTQRWAQEFKDVVSVCVVPGYVAYAHLTLRPAHPPTDCGISSLTNGTDTSIDNKESAPLSDELLRHRLASNTNSVEVTAIDLLPVETTDPKLHQQKLLQKVRAAMHQVPQCSVYVMPVTGVMVNGGLSVSEAAIALQRAQVMGAVQGLLAQRCAVQGLLAQRCAVQGLLTQRCAVQSSEIRYVRDAVVHDVFSLRVGKDIVTNLELLMKLLNGNSISSLHRDSITLPRLTMPPYVKEHFTSLGGSRQRTVAPALYTGLVLCSVVAATRTTKA